MLIHRYFNLLASTKKLQSFLVINGEKSSVYASNALSATASVSDAKEHRRNSEASGRETAWGWTVLCGSEHSSSPLSQC